MSTHVCNNAFYQLDFGANEPSLLGASPPDVMHMIKEGLIMYIMTVFTDSMTDTVRSHVDELADNLLSNLHLGERGNHLCINFTRGMTSSIMLKAYEWPGLAFAFLFLILTEEGATLCQGQSTARRV